MSSRGWEHVKESDLAAKVKRSRVGPTSVGFASKGIRIDSQPSKYRNVRTVVQGEKFDSKAEATYWVGLLARQRAGDLRELQRQVRIPLYAPCRVGIGPAMDTTAKVQVSEYVADFVYEESDRGYGGVRWRRVVADKKGKRTAMYLLKRKWLFLQDGIVIEEV